jgi:hypothetical protein
VHPLFIVCTCIFLCRIIIVCFFPTINKVYCIVGNGGWSNWTRNSNCSVKCGGGIQLDTRNCTNPSPNEIGASCAGESYYEVPCHEENCFGKFDRKVRKNEI